MTSASASYFCSVSRCLPVVSVTPARLVVVHGEPHAGSLHDQSVRDGAGIVRGGPWIGVDVQAFDASLACLAPGLDVRPEVGGVPRRPRAEANGIERDQA